MTTRFEVLNAIKHGFKTEDAIAKFLNISKDAARKHVNRLLEETKIEGFGVTTGRYFEAKTSDNLGQSEAANPPIVASAGISEAIIINEAKPSLASWRPHRIRIEAWHTSFNEALLRQQGFIKQEEEERPNITYYEKKQSGYRLQIYTHALFLIAPQPPQTPEDEATARSLQEKYEGDAYNALSALIVQYGLNLTQIEGKAIIRITDFELANTPNGLARNILENRTPTYIVLVWDRLTGEPRTIADQSILHELEAIIAKHAGWDSDMLKAFKDEIGQEGIAKMYEELGLQGTRGLLNNVVHPNDGWTLYKARLAASEERLDRVDKTLEMVSKNEATHVPFFTSQTQLNNAMIERLNKMEQQKPSFWHGIRKWLSGSEPKEGERPKQKEG